MSDKTFEPSRIFVVLTLASPYSLTAEEIEKDIRMGEEQIGWDYDYKVESVEVEKSDTIEAYKEIKERWNKLRIGAEVEPELKFLVRLLDLLEGEEE